MRLNLDTEMMYIDTLQNENINSELNEQYKIESKDADNYRLDEL